ncbi:hypothetical protein [Oceaniovalibus sp. ACAM 378]|uniref:hypothetical protein n=1 Tax=Oceaniovalibus sp. ACAM 378 TaxID=2599923 RepID=UPI001651BD37|nr:hypothetical protein [Oceaniovalibus sp. ACAM 378]
MPMYDPEFWANVLIFLTILMASLAEWDLKIFDSNDDDDRATDDTGYIGTGGNRSALF